MAAMADPRAGSEDALAPLVGMLGDRTRVPLLLAVTEARRQGESLYWVGGGVRDLLRGDPSDDLDLVMDAPRATVENLGAHLAEKLGGHFDIHPQFLTCRIVVPGQGRVDVACARRESYPVPGGLPVVERATLLEDLRRRDFTINALALQLVPVPSAVPIDPHGGVEDLRAGTLRVLYAESLLDDPTRIVRGVAFEARFGMRFDAATETAARQAIESGALDATSGSRLWRDLAKGLSRPSAAAFLSRLADLGVLRAISSKLGFPPVVAARLGRAWSFLGELAGKDARDKGPELALPLLGRELEPRERERVALRLALPKEARRRLTRSPEQVDGACEALEGVARRSAAHAVLKDLGLPELALVAAASDRAARWVREEVALLRPFRLRIDGETLRAAGAAESPELGRALERTRAARLDDEISVAQELEFALGLLAGRGGRCGS